MQQTLNTTLLIIGGGPGGYVAAIRAGQLGIPTILVEGQALGGTCLNIGCIPSKALIHVAEQFHQAQLHSQGSALGISVSAPVLDIGKSVEWKNGIVDRLTTGVATLLKKHKVQVIHGWAKVIDGKTVEIGDSRIQCEHLLLATGSKSVDLPMLPVGGPIISSTEALAPTSVPKHLVVVGGGYIGLELGIAYRKLGAEVSVVEAQERILPAYDGELTQPVHETLKQLGVKLYLKHSVEGFDAQARTLQVRDPAGDTLNLTTDRVLVAVGRKPNSQGWNLEALDLAMNGAAVKIDHRCQTSMRNVWAIGDLSGEPMLAHRAMAQGEMVAELIAGKAREFAPAAIPAVCFTDPELVVVGKTPDEAKAAGLDCIVSSFPFAANGRAMTLESKSGFVRVVARRDNHVIVGWQAVGAGVSELSTAFGQSLEMGARLEDIAGTIHAHPTLGEAVQEAALRALGHALHL
ncbi:MULTISPECIES: dihydrolipoyl dehydrogenase [unclassified Pseudomonas]|uniref:dihydrolipoyl dehydrogenase n=1 Tax=unclassified Pseudomonas TaxID=196821 RepID=UPI001199A21A|nr:MULTISPECIES: dihydrolipoyl dehydrogenase [unclassified Pseudomonas]TWC13740.1 dihydrolipoamide dehydrogenase [Pseudomonas sp. SJZ074]TWC19761.1 dihydrolipoamide dehydrogenase [Pseudomonas sp. SJZ075]TWC32323.1 dihydrolipoamide dehydrogenase [Pseudomonas sp. SJZ085]TWC35339.1 dihydrolipoamide dehydrogenase [Pseudomonas sp. SJZ078]TWC56285.1 dihydrolipoamide dehydrogenase [Pseudomonas sp. SJZ124]